MDGRAADDPNFMKAPAADRRPRLISHVISMMVPAAVPGAYQVRHCDSSTGPPGAGGLAPDGEGTEVAMDVSLQLRWPRLAWKQERCTSWQHPKQRFQSMVRNRGMVEENNKIRD